MAVDVKIILSTPRPDAQTTQVGFYSTDLPPATQRAVRRAMAELSVQTCVALPDLMALPL